MIERTPLTRDFGTSMLENAYAKFLVDYATVVTLMKFNETTVKDQVYDEAVTKVYYEPVELHAKPRINPDAKYLADIGISENVDAIFIVSRKELATLNKQITSKDKIAYKGTEYVVTKVSPMGQLKDLVFFDMVTAVLRPENV